MRDVKQSSFVSLSTSAAHPLYHLILGNTSTARCSRYNPEIKISKLPISGKTSSALQIVGQDSCHSCFNQVLGEKSEVNTNFLRGVWYIEDYCFMGCDNM